MQKEDGETKNLGRICGDDWMCCIEGLNPTSGLDSYIMCEVPSDSCKTNILKIGVYVFIILMLTYNINNFIIIYIQIFYQFYDITIQYHI